jgi:two-component system sensor histidine kinase CpxA
MKNGRLYLKFFLTFIAILLVTEMLIFSFFHFVIGRNMDERIANINRYTLSNLIGDKLAKHPEIQPEQNIELKKLVSELGRVYNARLWITQGNHTICSSFNASYGPPLRKPCGRRDDCQVQGYRPGKMLFSAQINLPGGKMGMLHMSLKEPQRGPHDITFALGLSGIGVLIAIMLFPLYRFISKPLSELKAAAMGIAGGNLSTRANIKSNDEIGELASAFNKMADNVERMVNSTRELTANISHELRSPLTRIRVAEELLEEKLGQPENARRYLESIKEETDEIDRLVGDILRLSKLDMNAASTQRTRFDIAGMLRELVGRWNALAEHSGIPLDFIIPDCPVIVHAIKDDTSRALDNLIANSIKFSDGKSPVSIRLEMNAGNLLISIRNTCKLLSKEELGKIFEPFYRVPGSTTQGTGLGLTIARKIAENSGGSLNASLWESGLEMLFSLPVAGKA